MWNECGQAASPGYALNLYNYTLPPADASPFMELLHHSCFVCRQINVRNFQKPTKIS